MLANLPWLALFLAAIGNCGLWLYCFNRVNAFGLRRRWAKLFEKVCCALCFTIPTLVYFSQPEACLDWLAGASFYPSDRSALSAWLATSHASFLVLGPLWLESRRWLVPPSNLLGNESKQLPLGKMLPGGSASSLSTRLASWIPLNEWSDLEVNRKLLLLPRQVPSAEGLTIGHLSDLHFTGMYRVEHYHAVVDKLMELQPQLVVISGDIIDYARCLPQVESVLKHLSAPLGVYFVLGNHDRRLSPIDPLIELITGLGFFDLGCQGARVKDGPREIELFGNELPWFDRRLSKFDNGIVESGATALRLGVTHTPDQIKWARKLQLDLLFAGHTHGGQVRLPGIGPIVAPSLYGSKFASGMFLLPPTLMHVSRGIAGTHPLRLRCVPEVSVLRLTNHSDHVGQAAINELLR
jgi:hypothetical protein